MRVSVYLQIVLPDVIVTGEAEDFLGAPQEVSDEPFVAFTFDPLVLAIIA